MQWPLTAVVSKQVSLLLTRGYGMTYILFILQPLLLTAGTQIQVRSKVTCSTCGSHALRLVITGGSLATCHCCCKTDPA